jgi:hypothetical protein
LADNPPYEYTWTVTDEEGQIQQHAQVCSITSFDGNFPEIKDYLEKIFIGVSI